MVARPDCPTPETCLEQAKGAVLEPGAPWDPGEAVAWIGGVLRDGAALRTLHRARGHGCDVLGLVFLAALLHADPDRLTGAILRVRFGPVPVNPAACLDVKALLEARSDLEAAIGPHPGGDVLDRVAAVERALQASVDAAGGQHPSRSLTPGTLRTDGVAEVAEPPIRPPSACGRRGDPALSVVTLATFGHLRALGADEPLKNAVSILVDGLHLGLTSGAADPYEAMRRRIERCLEASPIVVRARTFARYSQLPVTLP